MGKGKKALAPEILRINGAYEKHPERENKKAPKANGVTPEPPDYFDADELQKWKELAEDLRTMGIMSSDCREQMIAYCVSYGGWIKCRRYVETNGMVGLDGRRSPAMTDMHKFQEQMNRLRPEFGLTPSSRGKLVSLKPDDEENPMDHLISRLSN